MRTLINFLVIILMAFSANAQTSIGYKAIVKDDNGNVMADQFLEIYYTITLEERTLYAESQRLQTDANGLLTTTIGTGTVIEGVFSEIPWNNGREVQLNVQIDTGDGQVDLGDTPIVAVPYALRSDHAEVAANVRGLEAIDEGNGIGWRIIGRDTLNYGNIGEEAVDLSFSLVNDQAYGALGYNSFAIGGGTVASGQYATAMGQFTRAESYASVAVGRYNAGGGDPDNWNNADPLFQVGNGTSDNDRSNAFTITKSGRAVLNSSGSGLTILTGDSNIDTALTIVDPGDNGIRIFGAGNNGIYVSDATLHGILAFGGDAGGIFGGDDVGVNATSFISANPDLVVGGTMNSDAGDNGIISSEPLYDSSDMYLRSYDDVVVELDHNNDEEGSFAIQNSSGTDVFDVNESGDVNLNGILRIGTETIEDTGSNQLAANASLIPDNDNAFRLGNSNNRWIGVWAVDGTINTSDRREKKNIRKIHYGLKEVLQMQPVSFQWKHKNNPDKKLGLIAQDLQQIVPEVVKTHAWERDETTGVATKKELDRLGVYYSDLVPVLINAIKEQQQTIKRLEAKMDSYGQLEARLLQLEQRLQP